MWGGRRSYHSLGSGTEGAQETGQGPEQDKRAGGSLRGQQVLEDDMNQETSESFDHDEMQTTTGGTTGDGTSGQAQDLNNAEALQKSQGWLYFELQLLTRSGLCMDHVTKPTPNAPANHRRCPAQRLSPSGQMFGLALLWKDLSTNDVWKVGNALQGIHISELRALRHAHAAVCHCMPRRSI